MSATLISPNFNERDGVTVDMLVLHYTGMKTASRRLDVYVIRRRSQRTLYDRRGRHAHTLVDEAIAPGMPGSRCGAGISNINSRSIGIELVNPGHEFGYRGFPERRCNV